MSPNHCRGEPVTPETGDKYDGESQLADQVGTGVELNIARLADQVGTGVELNIARLAGQVGSRATGLVWRLPVTEKNGKHLILF